MSLSSLIVQREIATIRQVEEALARQVLYGGDLVTNILEVAKLDEAMLVMRAASSQSPATAQSIPAVLQRLADIRRSHSVLRSRRFLHADEEPAPGILDIDWFDENAGQLSDASWGDGEGRRLTLRRAAVVPDGTVSVLTLMMNSTPADCTLRIPGPAPHIVLLDSADPDAPERPIAEETLMVAAHSLVLLHAVVAEKVADGDA